VLIPRFSGDQYNAGRHIPPNEARRGDLIFYGPNGSQHVTLYLGNGQMLEASSLAGKVTVSPVRKPGMTPFLTRIIES
jgi:peptidoglycan DL-endopeptidase RipB